MAEFQEDKLSEYVYKTKKITIKLYAKTQAELFFTLKMHTES